MRDFWASQMPGRGREAVWDSTAPVVGPTQALDCDTEPFVRQLRHHFWTPFSRIPLLYTPPKNTLCEVFYLVPRHGRMLIGACDPML